MLNFLKKHIQVFNWYVAIYVPGTSNVNKETDTVEYVKLALATFSKEFGGSTAIVTRGAWMSQELGLVLEKTTLVYSYAPKVSKENRRALNLLALKIKTELGQESVAVEVRKQVGGLSFI